MSNIHSTDKAIMFTLLGIVLTVAITVIICMSIHSFFDVKKAEINKQIETKKLDLEIEKTKLESRKLLNY